MGWFEDICNQNDIPEFETGTPVKVFVKKTCYSEITAGEIYWAYRAEDGYNIIIEKFPMGLFHDYTEAYMFKSKGQR